MLLLHSEPMKSVGGVWQTLPFVVPRGHSPGRVLPTSAGLLWARPPAPTPRGRLLGGRKSAVWAPEVPRAPAIFLSSK